MINSMSMPQSMYYEGSEKTERNMAVGAEEADILVIQLNMTNEYQCNREIHSTYEAGHRTFTCKGSRCVAFLEIHPTYPELSWLESGREGGWPLSGGQQL